ncbi:MAG: response regulator, partial [Bacteroidia bacterium]|nr:response regulator [Bacteroidia bacterium]
MHNYILIDDNKIDLLVASKAIELSGQNASTVYQFSGAQAALEFIKTFDSQMKTVMLIDIQMPTMNGFEFMDVFEQFSDEVKQKYYCYF